MYNFDSENNFFFNIDHLRGSKIFFKLNYLNLQLKLKVTFVSLVYLKEIH